MKDPLIRQLEEANKAEEARAEALKKFPIQRVGDIEIKAPVWLAEKLLEKGALAALIGESGAGKSFVALDLGLSIASGQRWHGKDTKQGPVVYVAGEGRAGVLRRALGWSLASEQSLKSIPFYITPPLNLSDPSAVETARLAIESVAEQQPIALVIIDTWATSLQADENSVSDTSKGLLALASITQNQGAAALIVHHVGHGDKNRARGSSALHAALDCAFLVERGDDGIIRLTTAKAKDTEPPAPLAFRMEKIGLGILNEKQEEETSAYLEPVEYEPPQAPRDASGKWQKIALDTLRTLLAQHKKNLEAKGLDPVNARVTEQDWRYAVYDAGIPKNRFSEVKKGFIQAGIIAIEGGSYVRIL